jgi:GntR family transcriptional regulator
VSDASKESRPAYLQAADSLRDDIRAGRLQPGERLPSVRDLAERFGIAPVTLRNALLHLREQGWIYPQSTRGYFVREVLPADDVPGEPASEDYLAMRDLLGRIQASVDTLSRRVDDLESAVQAAAPPAPPRRRSPARKDRPAR